MAPPLITSYKLTFALKRVLETFLGGIRLPGNNTVWVQANLILVQILLYVCPAIELAIVRWIVLNHRKGSDSRGISKLEIPEPVVIKNNFTSSSFVEKESEGGDGGSESGSDDVGFLYCIGLISGITVLVTDLVMTVLISLLKITGTGTYWRRKKVQPSDEDFHTSEGNVAVLVEEDQVKYKGLLHSSTWSFIAPNIFSSFKNLKMLSIVFSLILIVCSAVMIGLCTPLVLNKDQSLILRGLGLFTICNGRYSALFHAPSEPATFDLTGQSKGMHFLRVFYILIVGVAYMLEICLSRTDTSATMFLIMLAFLPLMWTIGLLPPLDALVPWLIELVLHFFGGAVSYFYFGSLIGLGVAIFSSILVLAADEYFTISVILQCLLGFLISCDFGLIPKYLKASTSATAICSGNTSEPLHSYLLKLIYPLMSILCSILFVCLGIGLFLTSQNEYGDHIDDPIISASSKTYVELGLLAAVLTLLNLIRIQRFYLLRIGRRLCHQEQLVIMQRVFSRLMAATIHMMLAVELTVDYLEARKAADIKSQQEVLSDAINETSILNFSFPLHQNIFLNSSMELTSTFQIKETTKKSLLLLILYSVSIRAFALGVTQPKELVVDLAMTLGFKNYCVMSHEFHHFWGQFPVLLFLVSFPRKWIQRVLRNVGLFLRILYATATSSLIEAKVGVFGAAVFWFPITIFTIMAASVAEGYTLTSFFTLPILMVGFPRPNSFWKHTWFPVNERRRRYSTTTSIHLTNFEKERPRLDFVIYEDVAENLVQAFTRKIYAIGFRVNAGDCFLCRFDDRLVFLHVLAVGWNFIYIQVKGLEMQEQTSCHHQEAAWIDEMFESASYLKSESRLSSTQRNEQNSLTCLSYYFKRWKNGQLDWTKTISILNPLFTMSLSTYTESKSSIAALQTPSEKELFKKMFFYAFTFLWVELHAKDRLNKESIQKNGGGGSRHLFDRRSSVTSTISSTSMGSDASRTLIEDANMFPPLPGMETQAAAIIAGPSSSVKQDKVRTSHTFNEEDVEWFLFLIKGLDFSDENAEADITKLVKITWKVWSLIIGSTNMQNMAESIDLAHFFDEKFHSNVEQPISDYRNRKSFGKQLNAETIVKAFRYAAKLTLDHIFNTISSNGSDHDQADDSDELNPDLLHIIAAQLHFYETTSIVFCTHSEVAEWIRKKQPIIITMTTGSNDSNNESSALAMLHIFSYQIANNSEDEVQVYVGQLSSPVVKSIWANLNLELLYLTSDDDERYSIQQDKILLRNICTQCANAPLGYSVYDSIFLVSPLNRFKIRQIHYGLDWMAQFRFRIATPTGRIKIQINTLIGTSFQVYAYPSDDVRLLKARIGLQESLDPSHQHLLLNHRELYDHETVKSIGLTECSPLTLVMTLKGGPVTLRSRSNLLGLKLKNKLLAKLTGQNEKGAKCSPDDNNLEVVLVKSDGTVYIYRTADGKKTKIRQGSLEEDDEEVESEEDSEMEEELDDLSDLDEEEQILQSSISGTSPRLSKEQVVENRKAKARMESVQKKLATRREKKRVQMVSEGRASLASARRTIPSPKCKGLRSPFNTPPSVQPVQFAIPRSSMYTTAVSNCSLVKAEILLQSKRPTLPGKLPYTLMQLDRYVKSRLLILLEEEGFVSRSFIPKSYPLTPAVVVKSLGLPSVDELPRIDEEIDDDNFEDLAEDMNPHQPGNERPPTAAAIQENFAHYFCNSTVVVNPKSHFSESEEEEGVSSLEPCYDEASFSEKEIENAIDQMSSDDEEQCGFNIVSSVRRVSSVRNLQQFIQEQSSRLHEIGDARTESPLSSFLHQLPQSMADDKNQKNDPGGPPSPPPEDDTDTDTTDTETGTDTDNEETEVAEHLLDGDSSSSEDSQPPTPKHFKSDTTIFDIQQIAEFFDAHLSALPIQESDGGDELDDTSNGRSTGDESMKKDGETENGVKGNGTTSSDMTPIPLAVGTTDNTTSTATTTETKSKSSTTAPAKTNGTTTETQKEAKCSSNPNVKRCLQCNKKLSIVNEYECRCGQFFCSKHRHPEDHSCTFDYKEEGRKIIEKANPVITAPKLPQI